MTLLDVSMIRLRKARVNGNPLVCADGTELPFSDESFDIVLLVALLEHIGQPDHVINETWRVLKPDGEVAILVPNDIWMSLGRLLLLKWPPRYPGHLSWITPRRIRRMTKGRFAVQTASALPVRRLPFGLNMYYWTTLGRIEEAP
jgi:ubiquinone/menaquinone biosynthesis C-methylase UbiE